MKEDFKFEMGTKGEEVFAIINRYNNEHRGKTAVHVESRSFHKIENFCVMISNDIAELAVITHPLTNGSSLEITSLRHTRPCREFFDGRFII